MGLGLQHELRENKPSVPNLGVTQVESGLSVPVFPNTHSSARPSSPPSFLPFIHLLICSTIFLSTDTIQCPRDRAVNTTDKNSPCREAYLLVARDGQMNKQIFYHQWAAGAVRKVSIGRTRRVLEGATREGQRGRGVAQRCCVRMCLAGFLFQRA